MLLWGENDKGSNFLWKETDKRTSNEGIMRMLRTEVHPVISEYRGASLEVV